MTQDLLAGLPWKASGQRGEARGERLWDCALPHWAALLGPACVYACIAAVSICCLLLAAYQRESAPMLSTTAMFVATVALALAHHWFFHKACSAQVSEIAMTDQRILYSIRKIWLDDTLHDVSLSGVKAVEVHKTGIAQNLLDYGDIWLELHDSQHGDTQQIISCVPKPHHWAEHIVRSIHA